MCAYLRAQVTIGIAPGNFNCGTFDTCLLTFVILVPFGTEFMSLGPTQVHTQEHRCPVLSINAATASVNTDNGIPLVVFTAQHQSELQFLYFLFERGYRLRNLGLQFFIWLLFQQMG